jgi:hypothetical protein
MDDYIAHLPVQERQLAQNIGKALGDWPAPEDEEIFMRIVESLRSLCGLHYDETHFQLLKAAQALAEEHWR